MTNTNNLHYTQAHLDIMEQLFLKNFEGLSLRMEYQKTVGELLGILNKNKITGLKLHIEF